MSEYVSTSTNCSGSDSGSSTHGGIVLVIIELMIAVVVAVLHW